MKFTEWSRDISVNLGVNERGMQTHLRGPPRGGGRGGGTCSLVP